MDEDSTVGLFVVGVIVVIILGFIAAGHLAVSLGTRADNNQMQRWEKCMEVVNDNVYCKDLIYNPNSNIIK